MARVLVTGATGHLGAHLARDLLAHGHSVVALARPESDRRGLAGLSVTIAEGDLLEQKSLRAAADGCEWVVHAGAVYQNQSRDPDAMMRPAGLGTENVLRAAKDAGVRRVVHTSSNATIGYSRDGRPLDETSRNTDQKSSPYIASKCLAEDTALRLGKELSVDVVVVNPCGILGPWDYRVTPTSRAAAGMGNGGPSVLALAVTHASDIAAAHRLAAEKGRPGDRYIAAGENLSTERVAALVDGITKSGCKPMNVPIPVLWLLAVGQEIGSLITGRDPDLTRAGLRDVGGCSLFYDARKAREELGWTARSADDTLADAFRWLAWLGHLKRPIADRVAQRFPADPTWVR